ncbi:MAG: WD40 repeat domain-containing protein [Treponema sp.]|jgi:WD40 repeat protein|nr:WD40 repeat domain-containing protein [Treponema sp.]
MTRLFMPVPAGIVFLAFLLVSAFPLAAQSNSSREPPGKHQGAVTALVRDSEGRILSAGKDGFLEIWNTRAAEERFQLSHHGIESLVLRPGKPEVAIVESDDMGFHRVSAWDYESKVNLFTLQFRDSVSYINYSASGSFIIVAGSGRTGLVFLHSETGETLESPPELSGSVSFAATGRSERVMICYLSSGNLSYWDLETGEEIQNTDVPPNIRSPVLFGNSRFLGGFDPGGLIVLDAVTGQTIARDDFISRGIIFIDNPDSAGFGCVTFTPGTTTVLRMNIDLSGRLTTLSRRTVPSNVGEVSAAASGAAAVPADAENIFLGTEQGTLWLINRTSARVLDTGNPLRIIDTSASSNAIAFISADGALGYIPLDYTQLKNNDTLIFEDAGNYTRVLSDPAGESRFILWLPGTNRTIPVVKTLLDLPKDCHTSEFFLDRLSLRFPVRSAAVMGGSILFLDTAGTVSILNIESGQTGFSYNAPGSVDAAFIDRNTIILGRSASGGNTPFLTVNILTGETVPLAYPAVAGLRVHKGSGGAVYGAVVNQSGTSVQTSIIRLDTGNPSRSEKLVDYAGEDSSFAMAESGGNLASTLGGSGAAILMNAGAVRGNNGVTRSFERSAGLPVKIINGSRWFIVLDGEGCIAWHDNRTGKLLAVFKLSARSWNLETDGEVIGGRTERR